MKRLVLLLLLLTYATGSAHEWYPTNCCGGKDCFPLDPSRVAPQNDGSYIVDGKFTVRREDVQLSFDGRYHGCFYPDPDTLRCFFAPDRAI